MDHWVLALIGQLVDKPTSSRVWPVAPIRPRSGTPSSGVGIWRAVGWWMGDSASWEAGPVSDPERRNEAAKRDVDTRRGDEIKAAPPRQEQRSERSAVREMSRPKHN